MQTSMFDKTQCNDLAQLTTSEGHKIRQILIHYCHKLTETWNALCKHSKLLYIL